MKIMNELIGLVENDYVIQRLVLQNLDVEDQIPDSLSGSK